MENNHIINAYASLSFNVTEKMKNLCDISKRIAFTLEERTLNYTADADKIIKESKFSTFEVYASLYSADYHDEANTNMKNAYNLSNRIQDFFDSSIEAYIPAIKENVVQRVHFFYPWIRGYMNGDYYEITFFSLVEYRNGKRIFKVLKLIPDTMADLSLMEILHNDWFSVLNTKFPLGVFEYGPQNLGDFETNVESGETMVINSILQLFIDSNFGIVTNPKDSMVVFSVVGKISPTIDRNETRFTHNFDGKNAFIGIQPSVLLGYDEYFRKACFQIATLETYRDVLRSYRRLEKKKKYYSADEIVKEIYQNYIFTASKRLNIRMDMDLEEILKKKRKSEWQNSVTDLVSSTIAKTINGMITP